MSMTYCNGHIRDNTTKGKMELNFQQRPIYYTWMKYQQKIVPPAVYITEIYTFERPVLK